MATTDDGWEVWDESLFVANAAAAGRDSSSFVTIKDDSQPSFSSARSDHTVSENPPKRSSLQLRVVNPSPTASHNHRLQEKARVVLPQSTHPGYSQPFPSELPEYGYGVGMSLGPSKDESQFGFKGKGKEIQLTKPPLDPDLPEYGWNDAGPSTSPVSSPSTSTSPRPFDESAYTLFPPDVKQALPAPPPPPEVPTFIPPPPPPPLPVQTSQIPVSMPPAPSRTPEAPPPAFDTLDANEQHADGDHPPPFTPREPFADDPTYEEFNPYAEFDSLSSNGSTSVSNPPPPSSASPPQFQHTTPHNVSPAPPPAASHRRTFPSSSIDRPLSNLSLAPDTGISRPNVGQRLFRESMASLGNAPPDVSPHPMPTPRPPPRSSMSAPTTAPHYRMSTASSSFPQPMISLPSHPTRAPSVGPVNPFDLYSSSVSGILTSNRPQSQSHGRHSVYSDASMNRSSYRQSDAASVRSSRTNNSRTTYFSS